MTIFSRQTILVMSLVAFLFGGCDKKPQPQQQQSRKSVTLSKPPEVTSEEEEGFHDLILYIRDNQKLPDGRESLRCQGVHNGKTVGFEIMLSQDWKSGSLGKDIPLVTYQGIVTYRSTGAESDEFVRVVDELYGTKLNPKGMASEIRFTGISLEGDPRNLAKGPVRIKLFYESEKESDYAELFMNVELTTHRLEFHEKDEEYRSAVVKALTAKQ